MFSKLITLLIGVGSVYFFYEFYFILAVLLLVWFIMRLFGYNLAKLAEGFGEISNASSMDKNCNCVLEFHLNIEEILKDSIFDFLFKKIREEKHGVVGSLTEKNTKKFIKSFKNKEEWLKTIIENYKKKYKTKEPIENIKYNIKNNLLWKNGEIDFNDSIYHEISIPYFYKEGEEEESSFLASKIYESLEIRIFIVNGIIKLQIGDFSKEVSPEVIKKGLDVFKTHHTVTFFPLMYSIFDIPENYLNLSMYATESFNKMKKGEEKDFTKDWKEINRELADYKYLYSFPEEGQINKRFTKIIKEFNEKKEEWLKKEEFKNPFARDESNDDYFDREFRDNNIYYVNKYLRIFVADHNDSKDRRDKYAYTDYYEEMP